MTRRPRHAPWSIVRACLLVAAAALPVAAGARLGCLHSAAAISVVLYLRSPPGWCAALRSLFLAAWFFGTPLCRRRSTALLRTPPPGLRMAVFECLHQKAAQTFFASAVPTCGVLPKTPRALEDAGSWVVVVDVRICEELGRAKIKDMLELSSGVVLNCCGLNHSGGGVCRKFKSLIFCFCFFCLWPFSAPAHFEQTPHRSTSRHLKNPPAFLIHASFAFPPLSLTLFGSCGIPSPSPPPPRIPSPRVIHDSGGL